MQSVKTGNNLTNTGHNQSVLTNFSENWGNMQCCLLLYLYMYVHRMTQKSCASKWYFHGQHSTAFGKQTKTDAGAKKLAWWPNYGRESGSSMPHQRAWYHPNFWDPLCIGILLDLEGMIPSKFLGPIMHRHTAWSRATRCCMVTCPGKRMVWSWT